MFRHAIRLIFIEPFVAILIVVPWRPWRAWQSPWAPQDSESCLGVEQGLVTMRVVRNPDSWGS
jgi:hypothetical protein